MAVRSPSVLPGRACGAILVAIILASAPTAAPGQTDEEPLPEITRNELARRIRTAQESYTSGLLEVEFEEERDTNGRGDPIIVKLPGKFRYVGDGRRWRIDNDSMSALMRSRTLFPVRWTSGFDGTEHFARNQNRGLVTLGDIEPDSMAYSPRALFCYRGEELRDALESPTAAATIGQRMADGVRCYVVVTTHGESATETLISPHHGFLPIRQASSRGGQMYLTHNLRDVREVAPGVWAPGQIFSLARSSASTGDAEPRLLYRRLSRIVRFEPGQPRSLPSFRVEIPLGADVTDLRLGYTYHNDPWWPEIGKILREYFDWPKEPLWPLGSLASPSNLGLAGKVAPPIRTDARLNSRPLDWSGPRGKLTLVEFSSDRSIPRGRELAPLRRLYEAYHPAGLEVIAVHTPVDDVDEVRRFARDYRVPFPVVVDEKAGDSGATARAYGVTKFPSLVLVDHAGTVHALSAANDNGTSLLGTVRGFLTAAGVRDVEPIRPENEVSEAIARTVVDEFRRRAFNAPATGRIHGAVMDGRGAAIAGAKVEATMRFVLAFGGRFVNHEYYSGRRRVVTTGADGRFELPGLCKGTYVLKFTAEGSAGLEITKWIAPDLQPVTADAVLAQGDTIEGTVRDELGSPLAGVVLWARERRYFTPDGMMRGEVLLPRPIGTITGADGRFRFEKLMAGDYRFELINGDLAPQTFAWIPAGSVGVTALFKRNVR